MIYDKDLHTVKDLYVSGDNDKAYKYVKTNNVKVIDDEDTVILHIDYLMSKGYYEEGLILIGEAKERYKSNNILKGKYNLYNSKKYIKKAKKYNNRKKDDFDTDSCCLCCDCVECSDLCMEMPDLDMCDFDISDNLCCFFD